MAKQKSEMTLDIDFDLLCGSEVRIFDDLEMSMSDVEALNLLDKAELALKRIRARLKKQVAIQQRREQKLKKSE